MTAIAEGRIKGRIAQLDDGRWYWWAEFTVKGVDDILRLSSNEGEEPIFYETKEQAMEGLKKCSEVIQKELKEIVGKTNITVNNKSRLN